MSPVWYIFEQAEKGLREEAVDLGPVMPVRDEPGRVGGIEMRGRGQMGDLPGLKLGAKGRQQVDVCG